jgi:hypothetical protein
LSRTASYRCAEDAGDVVMTEASAIASIDLHSLGTIMEGGGIVGWLQPCRARFKSVYNAECPCTGAHQDVASFSCSKSIKIRKPLTRQSRKRV